MTEDRVQQVFELATALYQEQMSGGPPAPSEILKLREEIGRLNDLLDKRTVKLEQKHVELSELEERRVGLIVDNSRLEGRARAAESLAEGYRQTVEAQAVKLADATGRIKSLESAGLLVFRTLRNTAETVRQDRIAGSEKVIEFLDTFGKVLGVTQEAAAAKEPTCEQCTAFNDPDPGHCGRRNKTYPGDYPACSLFTSREQVDVDAACADEPRGMLEPDTSPSQPPPEPEEGHDPGIDEVTCADPCRLESSKACGECEKPPCQHPLDQCEEYQDNGRTMERCKACGQTGMSQKEWDKFYSYSNPRAG